MGSHHSGQVHDIRIDDVTDDMQVPVDVLQHLPLTGDNSERRVERVQDVQSGDNPVSILVEELKAAQTELADLRRNGYGLAETVFVGHRVPVG
jgi:hypothetical protein